MKPAFGHLSLLQVTYKCSNQDKVIFTQQRITGNCGKLEIYKVYIKPESVMK